jgi:hypothetical protein
MGLRVPSLMLAPARPSKALGVHSRNGKHGTPARLHPASNGASFSITLCANDHRRMIFPNFEDALFKLGLTQNIFYTIID